MATIGTSAVSCHHFAVVKLASTKNDDRKDDASRCLARYRGLLIFGVSKYRNSFQNLGRCWSMIYIGGSWRVFNKYGCQCVAQLFSAERWMKSDLVSLRHLNGAEWHSIHKLTLLFTKCRNIHSFYAFLKYNIFAVSIIFRRYHVLCYNHYRRCRDLCCV